MLVNKPALSEICEQNDRWYAKQAWPKFLLKDAFCYGGKVNGLYIDTADAEVFRSHNKALERDSTVERAP